MADQNVGRLLVQAREAYRQGNIEQARGLVKQVLALDGENAEAWLLVTYLTGSPQQQQMALNRAKKSAPQNARILQREEELFPRRRAQGIFVPDDPNLPPQIVQSGPAPQPTAVPPKRPVGTPTSSDPRPAQPLSQPQSSAQPRRPPAGDPLPTLADGVVLPPTFRPVAYLPLLAAMIGIAAVVVLVIGYGNFRQRQMQNSPDAIVLGFYPAIQSGDNATLATMLNDDAKTLCGDNLAACFMQRAPIGDFQGFSLEDETVSGQSATVKLRFRIRTGPVQLCQVFYTQNMSGTWKIMKDDTPLPCTAMPQAAIPSQTALAQQITPTLDAIQLGVVQTTTMLAQTQNSMLIAPTLTAAILAPGFTQTALAGEQNRLNTAIAATQTQSSILISQTAVFAGATSTTAIQTQIAATSTQQAVLFKATLKGTLATSQNVNGQPHIVTMNADGSNLKVLSEIGNDPAWSPDGQKIAFVNREHGYSVHTMAADGTADTELTGPDISFAATGYPTWSPDGRRLMFEANRQFSSRVLVISQLDGSGLIQVLDGDQAGGAHSWSPDGTQALYTKDDQIWIANVTGGAPHSVIKPAGVQEAAWSPDGKHIAFDAGNDQDRGIYIMNADGINLKRITAKDVYLALAAWSPDGKYIAAMCYDARLRSNNICVMNVDGTSLTIITTEGGFDGRISWKP